MSSLLLTAAVRRANKIVPLLRSALLRAPASFSSAVPQGPSEPDEEVVALSKISTQSIVDALWLSDFPQPYIHGAMPMREGMTVAGRAVTLRFVPHRQDIAADKPQGVRSCLCPRILAPLETSHHSFLGWVVVFLLRVHVRGT